MSKTVVVVCPTPAATEAIKKALVEKLGLVPVGEASSPSEAVPLAADLRPDFIVVAQRLADADEVVNCRKMRDASPTSKLVMLTWYAAERDWLVALMAGASACILVEVRMLGALADMFGRVASGENLILAERGEGVAQLVAATGPIRDARERQILTHVFRLETDSEIAAELGMTPDEVREHVCAIVGQVTPTVSRL